MVRGFPFRTFCCSGSSTTARSSRACASHPYRHSGSGTLTGQRAVPVLTTLVDAGVLQPTPDGRFVRRQSVA